MEYLLHSKELTKKANDLISEVGVFVIKDSGELESYKKAASSSPGELQRIHDLLSLKRKVLVDEYNDLWKSANGLSELRNSNPDHFKRLHRAKYLRELN